MKYSEVLTLFQNGQGTEIRTNLSPASRIILYVPKIDEVPEIKTPKEGASESGLVFEEDLSHTPLSGRRGPVEGKGFVFRNLEEKDGKGIWQSVHTDGNGVIIFNNASSEQFSQMGNLVRNLQAQNGGKFGLKDFDEILNLATTINLKDRYNSQLAVIEGDYFDVTLSGANLLEMPVKKPEKTRGMYIPEEMSLEWDPIGEITEIYDSSFLIISKYDAKGDPLELRHLNGSDAEKKYRLMDGKPVQVTDPGRINIMVPGKEMPDPIHAPSLSCPRLQI